MTVDLARARVRESIATFEKLDLEPVVAAAAVVTASFEGGGKLIIFGNGGSAADAQHFAAEFVGRFLIERRPLPAVALNTNSSAVTAIGNDYGYDDSFARQLRAHAVPGDVAWGLSTSGNSPNVVNAIDAARELGLPTIGFTGGAGGRLAAVVDHAIVVPADATPRIQEGHLMCGHVLCEIVETALFG
jgi:D-sedoheptulose 7-phosphate isomerase